MNKRMNVWNIGKGHKYRTLHNLRCTIRDIHLQITFNINTLI
jgi:hypothetical protein